MFTSPTVSKDEAAPVDATILRVALAEPEVADPELREDVPAEEAAEADEARLEAPPMTAAEEAEEADEAATEEALEETIIEDIMEDIMEDALLEDIMEDA